MEKIYSDIINFTKQLIKTLSQNRIDSEKRIANLEMLSAKKIFRL